MKNFNCEKCDFVDRCNGDLKEHISAVHDKTKDLTCEKCRFYSRYTKDLKYHLTYDHKVKIKYQIPLEALGKRENRKRGDASGMIDVEEEEYADDLVTISGTMEEAENTLNTPNATFSTIGLTISKEK